MKRFLIFAGLDYYPSGGFDDFKGAWDTKEAALKRVANMADLDWWHIVDTETGTVIAKGNRR